MQTGTGSTRRAGVAQAIDELDLGALGRAIWGQKRLIIGLTLLAAAIAFLAVNIVAPRYKSGGAGADRNPRKHLPAAGGGRRPASAAHRRSGSGDQPGSAHPVARLWRLNHPKAEARRATGIRSGAAWPVGGSRRLCLASSAS